MKIPVFAAAAVICLTTAFGAEKWIDGKDLPLEGKAFENSDNYYYRLPKDLSKNINDGVHRHMKESASLVFRFTTASKKLRFRWKNTSKAISLSNMGGIGTSGIDVYRYDEKRKSWIFAAAGIPNGGDNGSSLDIGWKGGPCLVYLPLYNGISEFKLGIDEGSTVELLPKRASGIEKPVVFYGTSITQGCSASRPGVSFVNRVGRDLDVPIVNLGFSGSAFMEPEWGELLSSIDASCYVIDSMSNMGGDNVLKIQERTVAIVKAIRAKHPETPIVLAEAGCCEGPRWLNMNHFLGEAKKQLEQEGVKGLSMVGMKDLFPADGDGAVDGLHPNDTGMKCHAEAFEKVLRKVLSLR